MGEYFLVCSLTEGRGVYFWCNYDTKSSSCTHQMHVLFHHYWYICLLLTFICLFLHPRHDYFVSSGVCVLGSYDNDLSVWEPSNWSCLGRLHGHGSDRDRKFDGGKGGWIMSLVALEDGHVASGSKDHRIKIWCLETFECVRTLMGR